MQVPIYDSQADDADLDAAMRHAMEAMESAGLTTQDLLDALPEAGIALMREWYGDAFVDDLVRQHATQRVIDAR